MPGTGSRGNWDKKCSAICAAGGLMVLVDEIPPFNETGSKLSRYPPPFLMSLARGARLSQTGPRGRPQGGQVQENSKGGPATLPVCFVLKKGARASQTGRGATSKGRQIQHNRWGGGERHGGCRYFEKKCFQIQIQRLIDHRLKMYPRLFNSSDHWPPQKE